MEAATGGDIIRLGLIAPLDRPLGLSPHGTASAPADEEGLRTRSGRPTRSGRGSGRGRGRGRPRSSPRMSKRRRTANGEAAEEVQKETGAPASSGAGHGGAPSTGAVVTLGMVDHLVTHPAAARALARGASSGVEEEGAGVEGDDSASSQDAWSQVAMESMDAMGAGSAPAALEGSSPASGLGTLPTGKGAASKQRTGSSGSQAAPVHLSQSLSPSGRSSGGDGSDDGNGGTVGASADGDGGIRAGLKRLREHS